MKTDRQPLVSIGIPVYNEEIYLTETLRAVKAQTYRSIEVIISDNASTDKTPEIVDRFCGSDVRFRWVRQPRNIGAVKNFQYVLNEARGDYFIWAGGHDTWSPDLISRCIRVLRLETNIALAVPEVVWIDNRNNKLGKSRQQIDTQAAGSPAGRALLMYKQMDRCSAFYGLHRMRVLKKTMPWPGHVGFDFNVLMRIAAMADIQSVKGACWYRRKNRELPSVDNIQRQVVVLDVKGVAARFPLIVFRCRTIGEFLFFKGSLTERLKLMSYALRQFFNLTQLKRLWWEIKI